MEDAAGKEGAEEGGKRRRAQDEKKQRSMLQPRARAEKESGARKAGAQEEGALTAFIFFFVLRKPLLSLKWSRWVRTPRILGKPWACRMLRNSKVSISNPKLPRDATEDRRQTASATRGALSRALSVSDACHVLKH